MADPQPAPTYSDPLADGVRQASQQAIAAATGGLLIAQVLVNGRAGRLTARTRPGHPDDRPERPGPEQPGEGPERPRARTEAPRRADGPSARTASGDESPGAAEQMLRARARAQTRARADHHGLAALASGAQPEPVPAPPPAARNSLTAAFPGRATPGTPTPPAPRPALPPPPGPSGPPRLGR
jgi:hypothetical protein